MRAAMKAHRRHFYQHGRVIYLKKGKSSAGSHSEREQRSTFSPNATSRSQEPSVPGYNCLTKVLIA